MSPDRVVPLHVLGTDVDVRVVGEDAAALELLLRERWHLALRHPGGAGGAARHGTAAAPAVVIDAGLLGSGAVAPPPDPAHPAVHDHDRPRLLQRLTQAVTQQVIGARTGDLLMLHAAALAHPRTGATVAFVAPGGTGKTTLCRTAGRGRAYVTDETVGIRRDGTVVPYLKPLSTRRPDWEGTKDEQAPGGLGLVGPAVAPWVAGVLLARRDPGHDGPPAVEALDTLEAVLALAPESSGFMGTRAPLRWLADVLERTGGARRVVYAEAASLEPLVAQVCDRESPW